MTDHGKGTHKISLIISTRNRAESLRHTLESLIRSPTFLTWEAIIVNNGSSDETALALDTFVDRLPLVVLEEPVAGKNRALNRALKSARGDLFVFTDDDVRVRPGWLSALFQASLKWPEANVFGGPIHPVFPANTPEWMSSPDFVLASEAFGSKPQGVEGFTQDTPYGANLAIRASVFQSIQFDENVGPIATRSYAQGSEYELMRRLQNQGERFVHVPEAAVEHILSPEQIEIDWLLGRAERIGRGSARIKKKRVPKSWTGWIPLYAHLQKAQWQAYRSQGDNPLERFNRMQRVHYWRGYIAESRALRSENIHRPVTRGGGGQPIRRIAESPHILVRRLRCISQRRAGIQDRA